jgi:hypothetical protein
VCQPVVLVVEHEPILRLSVVSGLTARGVDQGFRDVDVFHVSLWRRWMGEAKRPRVRISPHVCCQRGGVVRAARSRMSPSNANESAFSPAGLEMCNVSSHAPKTTGKPL